MDILTAFLSKCFMNKTELRTSERQVTGFDTKYVIKLDYTITTKCGK